MDRKHRAFDLDVQLRVGHDDRDLDDAVSVRIKAGHLEVDPDQVLLVDGQSRCGAHGGASFGFESPGLSQPYTSAHAFHIYSVRPPGRAQSCFRGRAVALAGTEVLADE